VRNLIRIGLRPVPTSVLITAARRDDKVGKLAGQGLRGRQVTIAEGPGAGLVIDVGGSNPGYAVGTNELPVQHALAALLSPGDTCFDVGANVGFFTLIAARLVGRRGRVVAFEPGPDNLQVLRQNLAANAATQVTVSASAVSNTDGSGRLRLADYSGGHSLAPPQATEASGVIAVDTVTLDAFVRDHDIGAPDVVKIDVEGAEPAVLEGMATLLDEHRPVLVVEIDAASQAEHDDQLERIRTVLQVHDYGMRRLEPSYFAGWVVSHWVCVSTNGEKRR
jgi:FkbM family methyltransferase